MIFLFQSPYSIKRKLCAKRIQKRKLENYRLGVDQILSIGHAELNGSTYNSIADLTSAYYSNSINL